MTTVCLYAQEGYDFAKEVRDVEEGLQRARSLFEGRSAIIQLYQHAVSKYDSTGQCVFCGEKCSDGGAKLRQLESEAKRMDRCQSELCDAPAQLAIPVPYLSCPTYQLAIPAQCRSHLPC